MSFTSDIRKINISLPATQHNLILIDKFLRQEEVKTDEVDRSFSPLSDVIKLNQTWLDSNGREIVIVEKPCAANNRFWKGETTLSDGTVQYEHYSNDGLLGTYPLVQLIETIEPKPGEYWIDGNNVVRQIASNPDDDDFPLCAARSCRKYTKNGRYYPSRESVYDLVAQVFILIPSD